MALYAFDGTWNSSVVDDDLRETDDTNVVCFHHAYQGAKWYVSGPGTRRGRLGKLLGGMMGAGARDRLEEAYKELVRNFVKGDKTIDIIGFSRGAAIALDFANLIHDKGIRDFESKKIIAKKVPIRFLGLWDVVGSFGVPLGDNVFQQLNVGHKLEIPENVEHAYHALALDERRQTFAPTRQLNAYEVWFRGAHSDVGGGTGSAGLSAIALRWMFCKAKLAGLPIDDSAIKEVDEQIDLEAEVFKTKDVIANEPRKLREDDRVHYTVRERANHVNPPQACLRETDEEERTALARATLPKREPTK